jgi:cyclin-dependent kinase 7
MAVSPIVPRSPSAATTSSGTAAKGKGLVVRNLVHDRATSPSTATHGGRVLTEQLNEDVRRKYVKGILDFCDLVSSIPEF